MHIGTVSKVTEELHKALQRLVPQLGFRKIPPTWDELIALVNSESSTLLVARDPDEKGGIIGVLTVTIYRVPTGVRSIIEDVIVDQNVRRQGVGELLMRRALIIAREKGASLVSLTSNPKREAANRLYQRMGFERRETNVYAFRL